MGNSEIRTVSRSYGTRLIEQGKGVPAGPEKKAPPKKSPPKKDPIPDALPAETAQEG
jgi:hypothetical protein